MTSEFPWSLEVKGLGKILSASLHPRPLLLFIGRNNSGKSYLASLLWGMLATQELWRSNENEGGPAQRRCLAWAQHTLSQFPGVLEFALTEADLSILTDWANELMERNKNRFAQSLFNSTDMRIGTLRIQFITGPRRFRFEYVDLGGYNETLYWSVEDGTNDCILLQLDAYGGREIPPLQLAETLLRAFILGTRDPLGWSGQGNYGGVAFLPASRTGFMLTYKAVVKKQLRQLARRREPEPELDLPLPMVSFLESMATGSNKNPGPLAEEADFLEREALEGRLEVNSGTGVNEFAFSPRTFDDGNAWIEHFIQMGISRAEAGEPLAPLPIHLSSSLVTEIAPLVFLLRYSKHLKYLILEEPESHLHPHLQRVVAQVITRLIRKGVAVWLTTHSENFCQQINNFISLGTHPARAALQTELGYTHDDYLLPEEVGAYQLRAIEAQSELIPLETTELGIAMPGFNDELLKLAQESQRLSESREVE